MEDQTQKENVETNAAPSPELTVSDLNNLKQIVEAAVRRGAFGAAELSSVGAAYDRLNNFLTALAKQTPDNK